MTDFEQLIDSLSDTNLLDKDFGLLVDTCECEVGLCGRREDNWFTRVLRINNMIYALHMTGTLTFSSYKDKSND